MNTAKQLVGKYLLGTTAGKILVITVLTINMFVTIIALFVLALVIQ